MVLIGLILMHLSLAAIRQYTGPGFLKIPSRLFHLDREANLPTLFCVTLWFSNALGFCLLGRSEQRRIWYFLAVGFLFFSIDEFTSIHESLVGVIRQHFECSGIFYFAWIIPYGLVFLLTAICLTSAVFALGKRVMMIYLAAAALFLTGSIGLEALEGLHLEKHDPDWLYFLLMTLEESLEMLGLMVLLFGTMSMLAERNTSVHVTICQP